jgi:DMSO/TMAO reductase YedYZ molybdopterin-dependent catalytic subunit
MISLHGNDIKRLVLGISLVLLLVSCASPAMEIGDATPAAPVEPSPQPTATPAGDATPVAPGVPSPTPAATPMTEIDAAVPEGILHMHPSEVDNSRFPITPIEELGRTGRPQEYDTDTYRLLVDGLVQNSLSLTYEDVLARPQVTETVLLICAGVFWDNATWTGTPLSLILEEAGPSADASAVRITGGDGYSQQLSLEEAMADGVFLAYEVNGETLPVEHGYPLRLVARHQYGSKWVKWVERIEVIA